jgi:serine/threonine-protein kinase HipA
MSATTCTLQIFIDDAWRDAAVLDMTGQPEQGVDAPTYLIYLPS